MTARKVMLNEWDGYVDSINTDATFTAVLQDTKDEMERETAEFPLSLLSVYDCQRIRVGSYLKFEIFKVGGKVQSRVWLRRWTWRKRDLERADKQAKKWSELFA